MGTTHLSVMMMNYLAGYKRRKAALLEWNDSGDLEAMEKVCAGLCRPARPYRVLEGDYYKRAGQEELAEAISRGYEDVLIDYGDVRGEKWTEFLRCEKQFLIGSFSEWRQETLRELELQKNTAGKKSWMTLAAFGSEETRKEFERRFGIFVERIPFSADAFSVTVESRDFFDRILKVR